MVRVKRMNWYIAISLFLLAGLNGSAQHILHHPDAYYAPAPGSEKYFHDLQQENDVEQNTGSRIQYRLDIGTALTSFGGAGSVMSSYLAPSIRYKISPKLDLHIGGAILYNHPAGSSSTTDPLLTARNDPSYHFYISGTYQVTERLVVDGSFMKWKMNHNSYGLYPYRMNGDFESYSLGFNYRIAKSFHVGAQINVSYGMNPYYYSDPLRPGRFNSYDPFYREW
jgi:long-subunit fatty acid transport protein